MRGGLNGLMADIEEISLEISQPVQIKAIDPFLRIRKKISPMVNLEAMKQTELTITGDDEEPRT